MLSMSMKILSVSCILSYSVCLGITIQKASDVSHCPCLPWSSAYGNVPGRMDCVPKLFGEGFRSLQKVGFAGMNGNEFCEFAVDFNSTACLSTQFMDTNGMPAPILDEKKDPHFTHLDTGKATVDTPSVCVISSECAGHMTSQMLGMGTKFEHRLCSSSSDTLVKDMSVHDISELAKQTQVDAGVLAQFGAIYVEKLTSNMTEADIKEYQAKNQPFFIWSLADHDAPRLFIKGEEVYQHTLNPYTGMKWDIKCLKGCK